MTSTTSLSIVPAHLKVGQQVDIESRTWPGINKPGGHATITKLHYDAAEAPIQIDVKYVLGGTEKQIELSYVKPHVDLARGGRSRRADKKMTVDSFTNTAASGKGEKENNGAGVGRKNKRKADTDDSGKGVQKKKKVVSKKKKSKPASNDDVKDGVTAVDKIEVEEEQNVVQADCKKKKSKTAPPKKEGKKTAGTTDKTRSIASYFTSTTSVTAAASSATTTSAKAKVPPKCSPNSILAVRAAHAKCPAQSHIFGTKTIGFSSFSFPGGVGEGGGGTAKKKSVQESLFSEAGDEVQDQKCAASLPSKKKKSASRKGTSVSSSASSSSSDKHKSVQNHKTVQSLYKNECVKAQDFVKSMVGTDAKKGDEGEKRMGGEDVTSSPESCLELEMDNGRMDLFNSLLSEVMFKKGLDSMSVDDMISSINVSSRRGDTVKPFTFLEVKAFLQALDSQNRIFVSWEEDNTGTIYSI